MSLIKKIMHTIAATSAAAIFLFFPGCRSPYFVAETGTDSLGRTYDLSTDYLITQYADETDRQANFYTIENSESFLILDGGWVDNADLVREVINAHGNHVDAWIISHPHQDHAGAFNSIYADLQGITIDAVYDNGYDYDYIEQVGEKYDDITVMETFHDLTKDAPVLSHLTRGMTYSICGLSVSVLNSYDDVVFWNVGGEQDFQNNGSLMLRIAGEEESFLYTADIKYDMESCLTDAASNDAPFSYVQLAHHGNWSFSPDFYKKTGAGVFFLDLPPSMMQSADLPASALKAELEAAGCTVLIMNEKPNRVRLR